MEVIKANPINVGESSSLLTIGDHPTALVALNSSHMTLYSNPKLRFSIMEHFTNN
jgi:hypothetical protein